MDPSPILEEFLIKRSQQKRRTSPSNYKERYFILTTSRLAYYECRPGKKYVLKGSIEVSRIKCVEIVLTDMSLPCNYKYPFQVFHENYYLYVFAPNKESRHKWVTALKEESKNNNILTNKFHPNFWADGHWLCCAQLDKLAMGCQFYDPNRDSKKPLPPTPVQNKPKPLPPEPAELEPVVVALYDFQGQTARDLSLVRNEEYVIVGKVDANWWQARDRHGLTGYVPSSYVVEKSADNLQAYEWYNKNITRHKAEQLLQKEDRQGAFMVRDSRQAGTYTVSVFAKASSEYGAMVKHYHIREFMDLHKRYYLAEKHIFDSIPELITYHQHNAAGLVTRLRYPVCSWRETAPTTAGFSYGAWEIAATALTFQEEVGSGQFGVVHMGYWNNTYKVAIKMIREGAMSEEDFIEEAQVMMKLSHEKLVQLYGVCTQGSPIYLVFEFMEFGCLSEYLQAKRASFTHHALLTMCWDVCEGMRYLESNNFIHRDLAARNCLIGDSLIIKVSDFGMTRFVLDDQYTSSSGSKFPVKWSAPEVFRYSKFSSKSDVWSFGVLMWEVFSEGRMPYDDCSNTEVVEEIEAGFRLQKPKLASSPVYRLMGRCWLERPEDRPPFYDLLNDISELSECEEP
ncbi:tyrosine-protein kinase ITK/TSK-like [Leucoraja erinacea]|uniref:tyrosine-protein kinase ITK/TSK-like n=1 Tax=Leucoraja erinaceus TaxID=7782 RepID=UPI002456FF42|nr:tyrosine-protein kinase ITK/TSK-like [Leucoraja erinacea]